MSEAIKTFQTLGSNCKISLIILKGKLSYILKKCMFKFIKYLILIKVKWKTVKILGRHNHLEAITLIGIGGRRPGFICPGGSYPMRKLPWYNYLGPIFLGGNSAGGNCTRREFSRGGGRGAIVLGGNCRGDNFSGDNCPGGNCPVPII